jgi:nicotinate-nucleotide pyrophosphorylase (carboxylating)
MNFINLLPNTYRDVVISWLIEDIPSFDVGGFVVGEKIETASIYFKSHGVLSGIPFAQGNIIL